MRNVARTTKQKVNTSTWMLSCSPATSGPLQALCWPRFQTVPRSCEHQVRLFQAAAGSWSSSFRSPTLKEVRGSCCLSSSFYRVHCVVTRAQQEPPFTLWKRFALRQQRYRETSHQLDLETEAQVATTQKQQSLTTAFLGGEEQVRHSTGTAMVKRLH